jgi:CubicO group peptidase (beta-lactamase class C family)
VNRAILDTNSLLDRTMSKLGRSRAYVSFLGMVLFSSLPLTLRAEPGGLQITSEQVSQAVREIKKVCTSEIEQDVVPGLAMAVVFQDQVVLAAGFGVRDVKTREPVNADTVFQLASLSKPIGSTLVAKLVGERKISWDSKISDLDPDFEMYDPWVTREITLRDFYAHRSGLPEHAGDLLEDLGFTRKEILDRLRFQRPNSSFRSQYAYTNFGITEAGVAAAKAYNLTWENASEQKLYKPLGMHSTSSRYVDFMAQTNKALGHVLINGQWVQKYKRDPDAESPAGGVSSSVNDLAKWMRLQLADGQLDGKPIVDEKALSVTHWPQILTGFSPLNGLPTFYGLGWNVNYDTEGRLRLGHSGAFALGAGTCVLLFTFTDLALYGKATQEWLQLFKKLFANPAAVGVTFGADYSRPPTSPTPPLANNAYLGTYTNKFFGDIQIVEKDSGLAIVEGPHKRVYPLKHYDRDIFTYETEGENAVGATGVTFTIGTDGKPVNVVVENLNVHGEGTFTPEAAAGEQ